MFEQMCYLIVCRQKANSERRRLLYKVRANYDYRLTNPYKRMLFNIPDQVISYRKHADFMRNIAKTIYSPLRRSLNIKIKYNSNNAVQYIIYQGEQFNYKRIQEIAIAYEFDSIVLESNKAIANPYFKGSYEQ